MIGTLVLTVGETTVQEDLAVEFTPAGDILLRGRGYRVLRGPDVNWAFDTLTLQALNVEGEFVLRGTVTDFTNDSGEVDLRRALP